MRRITRRSTVVLGAGLLVGLAAISLAVYGVGLLRDEASPSASREDETLRPALRDIPAGEFRMGSPAHEAHRATDEGPQRHVAIARFSLCETEVTWAQYRAVMGQNPGDCRSGCGDDHPVQHVSWFDAIEYLGRLSERENRSRCYRREGERVIWTPGCTGYRLPTEAEWEYAARAGSSTAYSFGDDADDLDEYAWHEANASDVARAVRTRRPNAWGLHDMHGNVWEWIWDWYSASSYADADTEFRDGLPMGPKSGTSRVLRGGSAGSGPWDLRSALRNGRRPSSAVARVGFRCARDGAAAAGPGE